MDQARPGDADGRQQRDANDRARQVRRRLAAAANEPRLLPRHCRSGVPHSHRQDDHRPASAEVPLAAAIRVRHAAGREESAGRGNRGEGSRLRVDPKNGGGWKVDMGRARRKVDDSPHRLHADRRGERSRSRGRPRVGVRQAQPRGRRGPLGRRHHPDLETSWPSGGHGGERCLDRQLRSRLQQLDAEVPRRVHQSPRLRSGPLPADACWPLRR